LTPKRAKTPKIPVIEKAVKEAEAMVGPAAAKAATPEPNAVINNILFLSFRQNLFIKNPL
jgi:hypothetical protein